MTQRSAITGTATASMSTKITNSDICTKELGVAPEKLKQTVEKVGVMATDVRRALGKMKEADEDTPGIA